MTKPRISAPRLHFFTSAFLFNFDSPRLRSIVLWQWSLRLLISVLLVLWFSHAPAEPVPENNACFGSENPSGIRSRRGGRNGLRDRRRRPFQLPDGGDRNMQVLVHYAKRCAKELTSDVAVSVAN